MTTYTFLPQTQTFNNSTFNFNTFPIEGAVHVFLFAVVTGASLAGSLKAQVSPNKVHWSDVPNSSQNLGATGGNHHWEFLTAAPYVRVVGVSSDTDNVTVVVYGYAKG